MPNTSLQFGRLKNMKYVNSVVVMPSDRIGQERHTVDVDWSPPIEMNIEARDITSLSLTVDTDSIGFIPQAVFMITFGIEYTAVNYSYKGGSVYTINFTLDYVGTAIANGVKISGMLSATSDPIRIFDETMPVYAKTPINVLPTKKIIRTFKKTQPRDFIICVWVDSSVIEAGFTIMGVEQEYACVPFVESIDGIYTGLYNQGETTPFQAVSFQHFAHTASKANIKSINIMSTYDFVRNKTTFTNDKLEFIEVPDQYGAKRLVANTKQYAKCVNFFVSCLKDYVTYITTDFVFSRYDALYGDAYVVFNGKTAKVLATDKFEIITQTISPTCVSLVMDELLELKTITDYTSFAPSVSAIDVYNDNNRNSYNQLELKFDKMDKQLIADTAINVLQGVATEDAGKLANAGFTFLKQSAANDIQKEYMRSEYAYMIDNIKGQNSSMPPPALFEYKSEIGFLYYEYSEASKTAVSNYIQAQGATVMTPKTIGTTSDELSGSVRYIYKFITIDTYNVSLPLVRNFAQMLLLQCMSGFYLGNT